MILAERKFMHFLPQLTLLQQIQTICLQFRSGTWRMKGWIRSQYARDVDQQASNQSRLLQTINLVEILAELSASFVPNASLFMTT
jgi:hypothetical protein